MLDLLHRQYAEDGDRQDPAEDSGGSHAKAGEAKGEVVESNCRVATCGKAFRGAYCYILCSVSRGRSLYSGTGLAL